MTKPTPRLPHHHEAWQIQQGANGPYCAACGASTKPTPRLPDPFRPSERPHVARTVAILAVLLGAMVATAMLTARVIDTPAGRIVKQESTVQTYDPGLYTPFTRPPVAP